MSPSSPPTNTTPQVAVPQSMRRGGIMRRGGVGAAGMISTFQTVKANYAAATSSRFRRTRNGLGGTADAHITQSQLWKIREYVRDMARNDAIIGQLVRRAVDNTVRTGFKLRPNTGDEGLDRDIRDGFWPEWAHDKRQCDVAGKFTFPDMERMSLLTRFIDGDLFVLPTSGGVGGLQMIEADWCMTPSNTTRNVVLGVLLSDLGRPLEYWFAKEFPRTYHVQQVAKVRSIPAYDADGEPNVYHIFSPERITQTRGMPAFTPVFDICGMFEDVNFAKVVQQQIVSLFGVFLKRPIGSTAPSQQLGSQSTQTRTDGTTDTIEELTPGMIDDLPPGVEPVEFSPKIPNAEFFDHAKLLLRIIGCNLGMPLVLVLLDTTNTTFHGYRGELNQAQIGFECNQFQLESQLHRPVYRWKMLQWLAEGKLGQAGQKAFKAGTLFRHKWGKPAWKSVDPLKDSEANAHRMQTLQASPSQVIAESGGDYTEVITQTVRDNGAAIKAAQNKAAELQKELKIDVGWRDVMFLTASAQAAQSTKPEELDVEEQAERETGRTAPQRNNRMATLLNGHGSGGAH